MEKSIPNKYVRWISELLVMVVCIVGYVFLLGWGLGSIWESEHRIYARVLEEKRFYRGFYLVDFIYGGKKYEKSIGGRGDLSVGQTVELHFFGGDPMKADWYSHHGRARGPAATPIGVFLCFVVLFTTIIPSYLFWRMFFRGRKPLPLITISHIIASCRPMASRVRARLKHYHEKQKQKTNPLMMAIFYSLIGVFIVCVIGLAPRIIFGTSASERNDPNLLAESYLLAVVDGRINDACEFICRENRYDFLSNVQRWKLKEYQIIGEAIKTSHITRGDKSSIWNVTFKHHSLWDGKTVEGTVVLGCIYSRGWLRIKTGYLPLDSSKQGNIDLGAETEAKKWPRTIGKSGG